MVSKNPVMGSSKKLLSISKEVADCCVDDQKALGLCARFESPHLTLLLTCWLVRYFGMVVQPCRVPDDLRRKTAALVVGIHLPVFSDACSI